MPAVDKPSVLARLMERGRTVSTDELDEMWQTFMVTRDPVIRARLAEQYALLVNYVARMVARNAPDWIDREDYLSYGYLGLMDAINKFKPAMGNKFETYATKRIRGAILDGLRKEDPLTRRERRDVKSLYTVVETFWEKEGRAPTHDELVGLTQQSYDRVWMTMAISKTLNVSLDSDPGEDDTYNGAELPDSTSDDPELSSELAQIAELIAEICAELDVREQKFIAMHYGAGMSLKDVGTAMGISDARVGQIRLNVISAVRGTEL